VSWFIFPCDRRSSLCAITRLYYRLLWKRIAIQCVTGSADAISGRRTHNAACRRKSKQKECEARTERSRYLYVVSDDNSGGGHVLKFKPGSTTGTDLGLEGLETNGASGIAITKSNLLVVAGGQIDIFPPRATVASRSFKIPTQTGRPALQIALSRWETKLYVPAPTL
jgi:hypothetical protein